MKHKLKYTLQRVRYESFGGIVSSLDPPFLAWVDKEYMRAIGYDDSPLWHRRSNTFLSAPTEVHFSVTERCSRRCEGCYQDSGAAGVRDMSLEKVKKTLRTIANMGVFHVALGGGEAFERADFAEIVAWCRTVGLVPNLTTNGQVMTPPRIELCRLLGQVNISLDGIGKRYSVNGRDGSFERANAALRSLLKAGVAAGINCVVSRRNFANLEEVVGYGARIGVSEIEFLKYKPSGRGTGSYERYALTQTMIREFYPAVVALQKRYGVDCKIDCSFIPSLAWSRPPVDQLAMLGVDGCDGGNTLLSVRGNGTFSGCSFVQNAEKVVGIERAWNTSRHLAAFRELEKNAVEPCRSCEYLKICRCGCRAVSLYVTGEFGAPDPECPYVYEYNRNRIQGGGANMHSTIK